MPYLPIESYGIIGDLHTVALVGKNGSIDWCCLPRFDSPSVFAAILDDKKGGRFRIGTASETAEKQMYLPDSNVLVTRFLSPDGVGEVTDFMPICDKCAKRHQIIRMVQAVRGSVPFQVECRPAFDYARQPHQAHCDRRGVLFSSPDARLALLSSVPLRLDDGGVYTEFTLQTGESATFVLRFDEDPDSDPLAAPPPGPEVLAETLQFWRKWLARSQYQGRWREMVDRSALVLKLLTYSPTGAIVAAPTAALPEGIGGERNWDYRYTWTRDAAFTIYAFLRLGYRDEAMAFMSWMQQRAAEPGSANGPLNVLYGIDGRHDVPEETLDHLEGYCGSRPVRIGNAAALHLQLDTYGELIDSVYLYDKYVGRLSYDQWSLLRNLMHWVSDNWEQPDEGIWEVRGGRRHFTYSKVQCWVALDRGIRMADKRSLPLDRERFLRERDRIYEAVMTQGWSAQRNSFVQHFDTDALDASLLALPLMLFLAPDDPRMLGTLDAIKADLVEDSLVYRYRIGEAASDGLTGTEGTFNMCSFWYIEALARAGRLEEARLLFDKMLTYANHLGLYAEQIGPQGEALGNFPQAFTHLALISAAFTLDRRLGE